MTLQQHQIQKLGKIFTIVQVQKRLNERSKVGVSSCAYFIKLILIINLILLAILNKTFANNNLNIAHAHDFEFIPNQTLIMPDGVRLSVNYWKPKTKKLDEKFPIVLEVLPYRKDDLQYISAYSLGAYLARNGIGYARVDIRGTGSSEGDVPDREYSTQELTDVNEIIKQLAALEWSNGNIGMQGISWSAFNSIMTAMQRPKFLKGILIAHGSDDIYANDIHNIDGALHLDIFTIEIETDNLLPQSPNYAIDKKYFSNRFEQKPWIFTYLKHQRDGKFWQEKRSLQTDYSAINVPIFAFASLLDGYRDYAINMLNKVKSPIRVAMGPQNHAWPNGDPGPYYEWRHEAVRWWRQVFQGEELANSREPNFRVFMRSSVPTDERNATDGEYFSEKWPIQTYGMQLIPQKNGGLSQTMGDTGIHALIYRPSVGKGILNWWGETTPDMRPADEGTLIYDSEPLTEDFYLLGNPQVTLNVSANAALAHWIAKLEDVSLDGTVSFITGGLINAAQRHSRTNPTPIKINQNFELNFPMHFTTWKFAKGHKIRLSVSNAQFPMIWPTPYKMTTTLTVGNGTSKLVLPTVGLEKSSKSELPQIEPEVFAPDATYLKGDALTPFEITQDKHGNTIASAREHYMMAVHGNVFNSSYKVSYSVNDLHPSDALFVGEGIDSIHIFSDDRLIKIQSITKIRSDEKFFHTTVSRKVFENGKLLRAREWKESIPRDFE